MARYFEDMGDPDNEQVLMIPHLNWIDKAVGQGHLGLPSVPTPVELW